METAGVFAIGGSGGARTIVSLDSNEDGGILWPEQQLPQRPFFQIAPDADGWLLIEHATLSRGSGSAANAPASVVVRQPTKAQPTNTRFRVIFKQANLRDWSWSATNTGYFPLARGVVAELHTVRLTSWTVANPKDNPAEWVAAETSAETIRPGGFQNLLAGRIDVAAATVAPCSPAGAALPPPSMRSTGGWLIREADADAGAGAGDREGAGAGGQFCSFTVQQHDDAGLHFLPPATGPTHALRLTGGIEASAGKDFIPCTPSSTYIVSGWIRTAGGTALVGITAQFQRFDGSPTTGGGSNGSNASATTDALRLEARQVGYSAELGLAVWEPLLLRFTSPPDAAAVRLSSFAEAGAVLEMYALRLR